MLTRFGTVSVRGLWREILTFPDGNDGTLTDLTTAIIEMAVEPTNRQRYRDDYGSRHLNHCNNYPALTASTAGAGNGSLTLVAPTIVQFYFPAEVMRLQSPGIYELSVTAIVGPEAAELLRDCVVFV